MYRIAVAGNPNAGKTCVFNELTGGNQHVGNYPGVTVEFIEGKTEFENESVTIIDLPGTYSLTAYSQEEIVSRDLIVQKSPEVIIDVVDASNLERNLYLTIQLIELNIPIVIALNMIDVAEQKGHSVNARTLSELFGVKVVPTVANKGRGIDELKTACLETIKEGIHPKPLSYSHELQGALIPLETAIKETPGFCGNYPPRWLALKLLEEDENIYEKLTAVEQNSRIHSVLEKSRHHVKVHSGEDTVTAVIESRYGIAAGAAKNSVIMSESRKRSLSDKIDAVVCNRLFGPVILFLVIYALFAFVFKLADEHQWIPLMNGKWVSPINCFELFFGHLQSIVEHKVGNEFLRSLLKDGIIGGVGGVLGFVPLIFFMFLFIAFLEDAGYVARVAFILDRVMRTFGLQGKSVLAMIVSGGLGGGGCAVPGIMATRTLREERDRLVTILVAPMMNCGAKMPVYAMFIAAFFTNARGAMMFLLWLLSWIFALSSAFFLRKFVVKGEQTPFVMELPVYHIPTLKGVLMHTWHRTWLYIKKAGTIILLVNVVLWAMMYFPRQDKRTFKKERENALITLNSRIKDTRYSHILSKGGIGMTGRFVNDFFNAKELEDEAAKHRTLTRLHNRDSIRYEFSEKVYMFVIKHGDSKYIKNKDARAYLSYKGFIEDSYKLESQKQLRYSFAGRVGSWLVPVSQLAGFDWKDNIALIGGFAAKEVVIGTLGVAYSMGEISPGKTGSLATKLSRSKDWNPIRAFAIMLFVMIYAPCFVAIATIKKETGSWKWAIFATVYSTILGFIIAVVVYQVGGLLL